MSKFWVYVDARVRICFEADADSERDARQLGWNFAGGGDILDVYEVDNADAIEVAP